MAYIWGKIVFPINSRRLRRIFRFKAKLIKIYVFNLIAFKYCFCFKYIVIFFALQLRQPTITINNSPCHNTQHSRIFISKIS